MNNIDESFEFSSYNDVCHELLGDRFVQESSTDIVKYYSIKVLGLVVLSFVYWILKNAQVGRIGRMYFISRDGQILFKVASELCAKLHIPIECRYIYGSRQAWNLPSLGASSLSVNKWIFETTAHVTVRTVCERVSIDPSEIGTILENGGFSKGDWEKTLSRSSVDSLKKLFLLSDIHDLIVARSFSARSLTRSYLMQEGVLDQARFGMVDIGWSGSLQSALNRLCSSAKEPVDIQGYYFAIANFHSLLSAQDMHAYYYAPGYSVRGKYVCSHRGIMELLTAANHEHVKGYERDAESQKILPLFTDLASDIETKVLVRNQQAAVMQFVSSFLCRMEGGRMDEEVLRGISHNLLYDFILKPTNEASRVYGKAMISEEQSETHLRELAPAFDFQQMVKFLVMRKPPHSSVWWEASARRVGFLPRIIINVILILRAMKLRA